MIAGFLLFLGGCSKVEPERRTRLMFDTVVSVTIHAEKGANTGEIFAMVWSELEEWQKALDAYDSSAFLFELNLTDSFTTSNPRLISALETGHEYGRKTSHAYDIRVGGIVRLWDFTGEGVVPSEESIEMALAEADHPLEIHSVTDTTNRNTGQKNTSVTIMKSRNTILDLGGLGKGIAAEGAAKALDTIPEIRRYIIDLGGNIAVGGKGEKPFAIGIRDPKAPDDVIAKFQLEPGKACATAGDYQRFFEHEGVRYHHIIDPKTGRPARKLSAVTVKAPNAATADILSTALFVMGYDEGMVFLKKNPSVRAAFFGPEGNHIGGNLEIEAVR